MRSELELAKWAGSNVQVDRLPCLAVVQRYAISLTESSVEPLSFFFISVGTLNLNQSL